MSFRKLLAATDFSRPSRTAFDTAVMLAAEGGAELVIVHIVQTSLIAPNGISALLPAYEQDALVAAGDTAEAWQRDATARGARRVTTRVAVGVPWYALVEMLRADATYDLAVLGAHGRTELRHALLGSVADRVVRHAPCPVLVVRARA